MPDPGHLAKIEADDLPATVDQDLEQVHRFLKLQSARYGRTRIRAKLRRQSVDIEADVHLFRQRIDDLPADLIVSSSLEQLCPEVMIVVDDDSSARTIRQFFFFLTIVANAYLDQTGNSFDLQGIVEDRGVGIAESFVGLPQVHVCVDLQDAEGVVYFRQSSKKAKGYAVLATHDADAFPGLQ